MLMPGLQGNRNISVLELRILNLFCKECVTNAIGLYKGAQNWGTCTQRVTFQGGLNVRENILIESIWIRDIFHIFSLILVIVLLFLLLRAVVPNLFSVMGHFCNLDENCGYLNKSNILLAGPQVGGFLFAIRF